MRGLIDCIEKNQREAVIHLLEIRHIKNPEKIEQIGVGLYRHINLRGKVTAFKVYNTFKAYQKSNDYADSKMQNVNGFIIVERL